MYTRFGNAFASLLFAGFAWLALGVSTAIAAPVSSPCPIGQSQLVGALKASVKPSGGPGNGGFENHEWAAVVARDGKVCAIAFSGPR